MSFYRNLIAKLSGLDKVQASQFTVTAEFDSLFRLHPTDHRNKGQVAVAEERLNHIDYCTSSQLHQKSQASLKSLTDLAKG